MRERQEVVGACGLSIEGKEGDVLWYSERVSRVLEETVIERNGEN